MQVGWIGPKARNGIARAGAERRPGERVRKEGLQPCKGGDKVGASPRVRAGARRL